MMDLNIAGGRSSPSITASVEAGVLAMQGDSYPENAFELFGPVIQWVETFLAEREAPLTLELELMYLNTSSIKAMMDILDLLEAAHQDGRAVAVNWYFDAENGRVGELAEEFKEDCTFPFTVVRRA
ncbi:DUF1987 domain-containing protein [Achromobacter sp. GG226]|uniref:biofilm regulation phosphoprotein SiaC n=1 Tax=Verticiella alkaliphila TaxID=2779529 RepID=UPI001C0C5C1E|nr:biofilm regulation phosphoprotein SiaC [Verticiella sp. GG226]MBU4612011.1 DUF1987 domain-containing protein [Verticiella sp. GG226]